MKCDSINTVFKDFSCGIVFLDLAPVSFLGINLTEVDLKNKCLSVF